LEPAAEEFCALCGNVIAAGKAQFVIEGSACEACAVERAAAKARKLMPLALFALLAALVPLGVSYATIKMHNDLSSTVTTSTRILVFTSNSSSEFSAQVDGASGGPMVRSYSDPVATAFGGAAILLGALGAWLALRAKNQRSVIFALASAALGAFHLLHGLGTI
jgi:hypothetical protein